MENVPTDTTENGLNGVAPAPAVQLSADVSATEPGAAAHAFGNFAHNNRSFFTSNPLGNASYHFVRSALACIPYGFGAALVWTGKNRILSTLEKDSKAAAVLSSPLLTAAQIAASFTFYRTVSHAVKCTYDRVFDENNSRADTIREMSDAPQHFWNDSRKNLEIQANTVPWAALTLGFIASLGPAAGAAALKAAGKDPLKIVTHADSNVFKQGITNTAAYSSFFAVADALAKHYRLKHDIPDDRLPIERTENENGETVITLDKKDKKYGIFTDDTSIVKMALYDVVPVAVGIGGVYTGAKRLGYRYSISGKQAEEFYKPLKELTSKSSEKEVLAANRQAAKAFGLDANGSFLQTAWREGAATSLFGAYTFVKDPWEKAYDNFFTKLEDHAEKHDAPATGAVPKTKVKQEESDIEGTLNDLPTQHASLS